MIAMLRKTFLVPRPGPGGAAFAVRKSANAGDLRLVIDKGEVSTQNLQPISSDKVNNLGTAIAALTLKHADDGTTVIANNAAATVVVTLPKISTTLPGMRFRVVTAVLPGAGAGTTITPNAADRFNGFNAAIRAKAAGNTVINTAATDAIGDYLDFVSDGVTTWWVIGAVGTWA